MGSVISKLLIVTSDFVLVRQNKSSILATCKAVHICEVQPNLETKKTTIIYPDTNSLRENNIKKDQLNHLENTEIVWNCVATEEANNNLREKLRNASIVIVSDKATQDLLENFIEGDNVKIMEIIVR